MNRALLGSIRKWEKIILGTGIDEGCENCPLCVVYLLDVVSADEECKGCPVMLRSGKRYCAGTPYDNFTRACDDEMRKLTGESRNPWEFKRVIGPRSMRAAIDEHAFLVSLLGKEK